MTGRIEVPRTIAAPAAEIFALLGDPKGHVAIDATGMLQDADGDPVRAVGENFVVHMDDWSDIDQHWRDADIFPVVSESALRAALGILDRTIRRA